MEVQEKIIIAADELFMRYGIRSVTMDDIARHLSISKKTIYQYFKDKDEIVCRVTKAHLEKEKEEFDAIKKESINSIQELFLLSRCLRKNIINLNPSLLFDLQKYHSRAWNIFIEFKEKVFKNSIVETLKRGIKEGYFRKDIDPRVLAIMRLEQVQMTFDDRVFPRAEFDFAKVQMQLFDHFLHGILTTHGKELLEVYIKNQVEQ